MTSEPLDLDVLQDGAAGRYALALTTNDTSTTGFAPDSIATTLITPTAEALLLRAPIAEETVDFAFDSVSSAFSFVVRFREPDGSLRRGRGYLFGEDGSRSELGITLDQYGNAIRGADSDTVVPILRGAGAIADATDDGVPRGVYAFPSGTLPADDEHPNGWLTLPRAADPLDGASIRPAARYHVCLPAAPFSSYVEVAPATNAQRTRVVRYTPAPDRQRYTSSTRLTAKVTWLGVTVWQRTFNNPGTFTTPALPAGWTGFRLSLAVQLDSTPTITNSRSIDR